jgi:hypothetical protein
MSDNESESDGCTELEEWMKERTGNVESVEVSWPGDE